MFVYLSLQGDGYKCYCPEGWSGSSCELGCGCRNGGICLPDGVTCDCSGTEFEGQKCETGTVTPRTGPKALSTTQELPCPPGFTGDRCDVNIDDCVGENSSHTYSDQDRLFVAPGSQPTLG